MDSVFCIVDKVSKRLFEVCVSEEVAYEHLLSDSYSLLREVGVSFEVLKRVVWKK